LEGEEKGAAEGTKGPETTAPKTPPNVEEGTMQTQKSEPPKGAPNKLPSDAPRTRLPLQRLVALLPNDSEADGRWGARRQGERIPFCKPIALTRTKEVDGQITEVEVEALFEGWSLNVCRNGMRIITEQPLKIGDLINVEVTSSGVPYVGQARVCWVRAEADGVIAGLQFDAPAP